MSKHTEIPQHVATALQEGGVVYLGDDKFLRNMDEAYEHYGVSKPKPKAEAPAEDQAVDVAQINADWQKKLDASNAELQSAKDALEPFQKRNKELGDLVTALTPRTKEGLTELKVGQLRTIASFNKIEVPEGAKEADLVNLILEAQKKS